MSDDVLTPNVVPVDHEIFYADPVKWMRCASATVRVVVTRGTDVVCVIGGTIGGPSPEELDVVGRLDALETSVRAAREGIDRIEQALRGH